MMRRSYTKNNQASSAESSSSSVEALTREQATESNAIEIPSISLPKGGGALKGIDEKFEVNASNGTASFTIPLPITPGRNGFNPAISLNYNSGAGNGVAGLGWQFQLPSISRGTDKRLPRYLDGLEDDIFQYSGAEDLVPYLQEEIAGDWQLRQSVDNDYTITRYRPRVEGDFSRIERILHPAHGTYWKVTTRDNVVTIFGRSGSARIADPEDGSRIYKWLPEFSYDDKGNWIQYEYKPEDSDGVPNVISERNRLNGIALFTNQYLKRVRYGNKLPYYADPALPYDPSLPADNEHFFELVFDYGEHHATLPLPSEEPGLVWKYRPDAFSSFRSGFEIRTSRLCERVLMFHHFVDEAEFGTDYLVRSLSLTYVPSSINDSGSTEVSYLQSVTQSGFVRKSDGTYSTKSLPPLELEYQSLKWNTAIQTVSSEQIANAPVGLTNNYQWLDFYGEGISGILTEQGEGWFYKSNLGDVKGKNEVSFTVAQPIMQRPAITGLESGSLALEDLQADGQKQMVVYSDGIQGYFELTEDNDWDAFRAFEQTVRINLSDPNMRRLDLDGDGQAELVVAEDDVFVWYRADGKKGFRPAERIPKPLDDERGPAVVFSSEIQTIFLADMSGDGLTDIVRIRNGEVCYWANKGYGRFSAKINMGNAPVFDHPDLFDPKFLHLADVSGTGATDLIYLGKNRFRAFINHSGNDWSDAQEIEPFAQVDENTRLSVVDLLGSGTSCIVWSSDLPAHSRSPMRYIDLMSSRKPHVLVNYKNNFGKETTLEYKSSTYYYLKDKLAGKRWATKLPFPVQVVSKITTDGKVSAVRFTSEYSYHHGYYDHPEREFRGFGRVDQIDTEEYEEWLDSNTDNLMEKSLELYQQPVLTRTWYHTGAFLDQQRIVTQFTAEYWYEEYNRNFPDTPLSVIEPQLPDAGLVKAESVLDSEIIENLTAEEWREALRACKGMVLRQEVFTLDAPVIATTEELQRQAKPYTVASHNCLIQLLQPRKDAEFAVFLVSESEAVTYQYERNVADPRINHSLNIAIDELGNILENVAVAYGRDAVEAGAAMQTLNDSATDFAGSTEQAQLQAAFTASVNATEGAQKQTHIIYTENRFTNDVDTTTALRLRTSSQVRTFEITGLALGGTLYELSDFTGVLTDVVSSELEYHEHASLGIERRLIEHIKTFYYKDDLTGPLLLHELESSAIPHESFQLAYTPNSLTHVFGSKIAVPETTMLDGKYVHSEGDANWWIRSGTIQYIDVSGGETEAAARNRFYVPLSHTDPYGAKTSVDYYRDYFLVMESTTDALLNTVHVEKFSFRTISPTKMRDINDNLSEVIVDELGLVKAVALLGKDLNGDGVAELEVCDNLTGLEESTDTEISDIEDFFHTEDSEVLKQIGARLLQNATNRFVYDFDAYRTEGKPTVIAAIRREEHHSLNPNSNLQFSFEYTDGTGKVAMVKVQAPPGFAHQAVVNSDDTYTVTEVDTSASVPERLRWIGSGRTVLNNKGNPVKQYEPYFSVTPHYEDARELIEAGVTPIIFYDALGRVTKTQMPDGTFAKVEFSAWQQQHYDQNDTVADSRWYDDRINNNIDAELIAAGKDPVKEKVAAQNAAGHHDTPSAIHLDSLGRSVLSISNNGRDAASKENLYTIFIDLDIEGNAIAATDARGNTAVTYRYDMLGHRVYQDSMDAGERWLLTNVMSNPIHKWDSRDHLFTSSYDALQRPLEARVEGGDGPVPLDHVYERNIYGEGQANDKQLNLRGAVVTSYDCAGKVQIDSYDLKGNTLTSTRRLATDYKNVVDWSGANPDTSLEVDSYPTHTEYDALNRVVLTTTADNSIQKLVYNESDLLKSVEVTQAGEPAESYVTNIEYDEKGQRTQIVYGNGVVTNYGYDSKTFRLIRLESRKANNELLQNLNYTYDPVGNISHVEDKSVPVVFFNNQKIEGISTYTYDSLYRLIEATGREHAGQAITFGGEDSWQDLPFLQRYSAGDVMAWRNYTQSFQYDPVGNIGQIRHVADAGSWTRDYSYESGNNRLVGTSVGGQTYSYPHHPDHGFIQSMPHLQVMDWNFRDELQAVAKQSVVIGSPETTYYVYDSQGQRVRKITENAAAAGGVPTLKNERLYLGGIEIYKEHSGTNVGLERITLHVMDDMHRIAMIDSRNAINDGTDTKTVRYQFGNHLGSVAIETDENANVISYEEYHPYGTTSYQAVNASIKAAAKRYRYTGMERDEESGLCYHGARYLACWLGRWCSSDPIGIDDGINTFMYVHGNPATGRDPSGTVDETEAARKAAQAAAARKKQEAAARVAAEARKAKTIRDVKNADTIIKGIRSTMAAHGMTLEGGAVAAEGATGGVTLAGATGAVAVGVVGGVVGYGALVKLDESFDLPVGEGSFSRSAQGYRMLFQYAEQKGWGSALSVVAYSAVGYGTPPQTAVNDEGSQARDREAGRLGRKVPYRESDLAEMARAYRLSGEGDFTGNNVAVIEYEAEPGSGQLEHFVVPSQANRHSERWLLEFVEGEGLLPEQVTRVYSEYEFCNFAYCNHLVAESFPEAELTFSFDYEDQSIRSEGKKEKTAEMRLLRKEWEAKQAR